ncbi:MAG: hypothetical protein RJQ14_11965, partial [Marinoscillum sp.]
MCICSKASAQQRFGKSEDVIEVGESMRDYIRENHVEEIENIVHKFTESRVFLEYLLEQGHHISPDSVKLRRKDVRVGSDIDVFVKHFTEHQNFTMLLVPVDIYPLMIYDTLLFSVVEVSDSWLREKYYYHDLTNDSVKSELLSTVNHDLITDHMFDQVMRERNQLNAEVQVKLHESYISTNHINLNTHDMSKEEKKEIMHSWGLMKKLLTHNLDLNVEMNIYIFGYDDMRIIHYTSEGETN